MLENATQNNAYLLTYDIVSNISCALDMQIINFRGICRRSCCSNAIL